MEGKENKDTKNVEKNDLNKESKNSHEDSKNDCIYMYDMTIINYISSNINLDKIIDKNMPSFSGILSGECKGKCWIDDKMNPTLSIAYSVPVGSFAFLCNDNEKRDFNGLSSFLENEVFSWALEEGFDYFEFSSEQEYLKQYLLHMYGDRNIMSEKEYSFRINQIPPVKDIKSCYQLCKVDLEFMNKIKLDQIEDNEFLVTRILSSWNTVEDFLQKSKAYCVLYENSIVAVIVGTARYENVIAIDIETKEEHRGCGLAYAISQAFIEECLNCNITPQWDCVESNVNSYQLAKKLGFQLFHESDVYWFAIKI